MPGGGAAAAAAAAAAHTSRYNDTRIIGFDPWPLVSRATPNQAFALGLLEIPELLAVYTELGKVVVDRELAKEAVAQLELQRRRIPPLGQHGIE